MRTLALRVLIGSIVLSALTGIWVLLFGNNGDLEGKVLITALSTSALSILVMACGAALERRTLAWLPQVGTGAGIGGYLLLMVAIWELATHRVVVQCSFTLVLVSVAIALASLLSLATLAPRFGWVRLLGYASDAALMAYLMLFVWELLDLSHDLHGRVMGVLAILVGAVTIAVPILHRMSLADGATDAHADAGPRETVRHCVACGSELKGSAKAECDCARCGARFRVEFCG